MNLKMLLIKRGISQIEISRIFGLHPSTICQLVNQRKMIADCYIPEFCKFIGIDLFRFLEGEIKEI